MTNHGTLYSLGENMIELVVEGAESPPEALFRRFLSATDRRDGARHYWKSGSLSLEVSALLNYLNDDPAVREGREIRQEHAGFTVYVRIAGDAYDVLTIAAELGRSSVLLSAVGDDAASDFMMRWMRREGVDASQVAKIPMHRVGVHFLVSGTKRYSRHGSAAAHYTSSYITVSYRPEDVLHTMGGTSQMLSPELRRTVREQVERARAAGARVSYNLNDRPDLRESAVELYAAISEVLPQASWGFFGMEEAMAILPLRQDRTSAAAQIAEHLYGLAPHLETLFVTDGARGVILFNGGGEIARLEPDLVTPEQVVEPVGAGDAFCGGTLHALMRGFPAHRAAEVGMVTSQLNTLGRGAVVIPSRTAVADALANRYKWTAADLDSLLPAAAATATGTCPSS